MLRGLRAASSGPVGKTIMSICVGLLVIAFGYWGIGDIFRNGFAPSAVATVGSARMTVDEFRQLYNNRLQLVSRQLRQPISPDQARALGFDRQVLAQWMQETALDQVARKMRLGISEAEVAKRITDDPSFHVPGGAFDRTVFQDTIQQLGLSEQGYVAQQRRDYVRRQITSTLTGEVAPSNATVEALNRYQNEQRDADYVVLTQAQAGDIPAPAPDVLAKYFDEHKILFRAPEYRKATILALLPEDVARTIEISNDDAKSFYDKNAARFSVPEKRQVEQILFTDKDDAHKTADRLAGGLKWDDLAKEPNHKPIDLGLIQKAAIADGKVADAAFSLAQGQTSGAIDGVFGSVIVHVSKIEPGSSKTFADVEGDIKKGLALAKANEEIRKLRDKVDEELGGGTPLDEIAKKLKIPDQSIEAIDRSGRDPAGKPVDLPKGVDVVDGIFSADVGIENDALRSKDGGTVWYDLLAVTPSRDRTLDEVKDRVAARWHDDQVVARLDAKVKEMVDKLKGGATLADLAAADKVKVAHTAWLKRADKPAGVPPDAMTALFETPKGAAVSAQGNQPTERVVLVVKDVTEPAFDPATTESKRLAENLRTGMAEDLFEQFITRVQSDVGVTVDQKSFDDALGANQQQQQQQ
ncbi:MAG TPA: SurA N-terminal domain-containing protein [Xanthobacteraceae bacterium]|nr:SurA N-terminal domain-containing protein [Xanthobacteraceae bacterium]